MLNRKTVAVLSILAVALLAFSANYVVAKPGPGCAVRDNGCQASGVSFKFVPNPGTPTIPCQQGGKIYRLSASITCGFGLGEKVSGLVCGPAHTSISFNVNGQIHTFEPAAGRTWEDVIDDCASYLTYSVN